jgi:hypothetical protein
VISKDFLKNPGAVLKLSKETEAHGRRWSRCRLEKAKAFGGTCDKIGANQFARLLPP